jgi:hypothetical protein
VQVRLPQVCARKIRRDKPGAVKTRMVKADESSRSLGKVRPCEVRVPQAGAVQPSAPQDGVAEVRVLQPGT